VAGAPGRVTPSLAIADGQGLNLTVLGSTASSTSGPLADRDLVRDSKMPRALQDELVALA